MGSSLNIKGIGIAEMGKNSKIPAYNYASFARAFEKGLPDPDMTSVARILFEPVFNLPELKNQAGNEYYIDSTNAGKWYKREEQIPKPIKKYIANHPESYEAVADHISTKVIDKVILQSKESSMYSALNKLIAESDLSTEQKQELDNYRHDGDNAAFLAYAFLYAIPENNKIEYVEGITSSIEDDVNAFRSIAQKSGKPEAITPPKQLEDHELKYVDELFKVYTEEIGEPIEYPEDLDSHNKYKKNFDRQRKDYYKAETIRREIRDTITEESFEGFEILKDEIHSGVIDTCDDEYDCSFDRLNSVMKHATTVQISNNLNEELLGWVGPGEKKGVCHMLVNDERLKWTEDEDE